MGFFSFETEAIFMRLEARAVEAMVECVNVLLWRAIATQKFLVEIWHRGPRVWNGFFGGVNTKCHFIATRTSLPRRLGETHLQMRQSQTGVFGFFFAAPYTWREIVYQLPVILPSGAFNKFAANVCLMTEMSYRTHVVWWPGSAAAHTKKSEIIWSPQRHGTSIFVIFAAT